MKDIERCGKCRFYNTNEGECRRYPSIQDNYDHTWGSPPVDCDNWYGEWQAVDVLAEIKHE